MMLEPDEDESGRWFVELAEAPINTLCAFCDQAANYLDEEKTLWCTNCAGLYDWEMRMEASL